MKNEELKKKIVKILANCKCEECAVEYCADCEGNPSIEHCREKQQADALIAAGIDDVKEAEHRAEVAEKMFDILHEESSMYMKVFSKEWYKQQAEKELAEEGKE